MKIKLNCEVCGKEFERSAGEVSRNKKLGRRVYCSRRCVGLDNVDNIPIEKRYHPENLQEKKKDALSPFRFHMKCMRNRSKRGARKECCVTLQDLKKQWDKQGGICPYTGWKLKTPDGNMSSLPKTPDRASLDRIDSSKPYTKDNIQFVSLMAQYAKNGWSGEDVLNFCEAVVQNRNNNNGKL